MPGKRFCATCGLDVSSVGGLPTREQWLSREVTEDSRTVSPPASSESATSSQSAEPFLGAPSADWASAPMAHQPVSPGEPAAPPTPSGGPISSAPPTLVATSSLQSRDRFLAWALSLFAVGIGFLAIAAILDLADAASGPVTLAGLIIAAVIALIGAIAAAGGFSIVAGGFFAAGPARPRRLAADIHHDELSALALPAQPPGLRERLTGTRELELERVALLPPKLGG